MALHPSQAPVVVVDVVEVATVVVQQPDSAAAATFAM